MPGFVCTGCSKSFEVPQATLDRYPGWEPRLCLKCRRAKPAAEGSGRGTRTGTGSSAQRSGSRTRSLASAREEGLTLQEVLAKYTTGPKTGVFTDGAADPNPGPGGWGAVYVVDDVIQAERDGHEPATTNNRMELQAILAGIELVPIGTAATLFTDSELCVKTFTQWAAGWERRGWKRRDGPIKNLELVQRTYALLKTRPELELRWIAAHSGHRWNEYADALATAYRRSTR